MIPMFFETVTRTLVTLAQASWRKTPKMRWKKSKWVWFYLKWSSFLLITMLLMPRRGVLFCALYSWFRPADDILDGEDTNPPMSMSDYINQKNDVIKRFTDGTLRLENVSGIDRLLVVTLCFAKSIGLDKETRQYVPIIWQHMVDEYQWRINEIIPTAIELDKFARSQDEAIFRLAALALGADNKVLNKIGIDCTGVLTRTDWISDIVADLKTGLVHLSCEACCEVGITHRHITKKNASHAMKNSLPLHSIVLEEIKRLDVLWEKVGLQKEALETAFPNKIMSTIYTRIMLNEIELSFKKVKIRYQ